MFQSRLVRQMTASDLPEVATIEQQCAGGWNMAQLNGQLAGNAGFSLVLCLDPAGQPVAHLCGMAAAGEAEILRLAVEEGNRRQGHARHLLTEALKLLASRGEKECWLEVRQTNQAAIALYRGCGFTEEGRRRAYYSSPTEDAVLMKKDLKEDASLEEHQRM